MSAQALLERRTETPVPPRAPRLRPVPEPPARLARMPFLGVLIAVFGLGMTGLLMLNTTLQNQTFQARALTREATELAHVQADLERQLAEEAAPPELARRASALGLRPNPHPAFVVLPGGKLIGEPEPVRGQEMTDLVVKTPAQLAAHRATVRAKKAAAKAKKEASDAKAAAKRSAQARADAARSGTPAAAAQPATPPAPAPRATVPRAGSPGVAAPRAPHPRAAAPRVPNPRTAAPRATPRPVPAPPAPAPAPASSARNDQTGTG